jgi:hypothetical protein
MAVENLACSQYLQRLETVIFSDYRLVANFMNACQVAIYFLSQNVSQCFNADPDPGSQTNADPC